MSRTSMKRRDFARLFAFGGSAALLDTRASKASGPARSPTPPFVLGPWIGTTFGPSS